MTSLDRNLVSQTIEVGIDKIIHQELDELNLIKEKLEKNIEQNTLQNQFVDDLRTIQCTINKAQQIEASSKLSTNEKVKKVLKEIQDVIEKVKAFRKRYHSSETLPYKVFADIKAILISCQERLNSFREKLEFYLEASSPIKSLIKGDLNKDSTKATLKIWVEAMELFAEGLEEYFEIFPETSLGIFEDLALTLLSISSNRSYETTQKESFRRRLRYVGTFILNLVKKKRLERLKEESAEIKAIRRLSESEEREWIPVLEDEQDINMDKINARIKERGYRTKLSCSN